MKRKKEFIINVVYIAIICALIYFGINYLLSILFPFIMGFVFAYLAIKLCKKVFKEDKKHLRILSLLLIYILIILSITLIVSLGINKIGDFIKTLPNFYTGTLEPYLSSLESTLETFVEGLPEIVSDSLGKATDTIFDTVKTLLSSLASSLVNVTRSFIFNAPEVLVSIILTLVTSFYFVIDYDAIAETFTNALPDKWLYFFYEIKDFVENTLVKILTAYAMIMGVTFIELVIGLTILGISNSGLWSLLIALLDILPVLGVGTVLIPWGISSLITGRIFLGISILVLYIIISIVRNIIEPRFVGINLELHPLVTLMSMVVGLKLFGALGMFGLPLVVSFVKNRNKPLLEETE